eukprot:s1396_g2.t1
MKFLPSWKVGQKVKAVNIVDQASCFQIMVPFHEQETSALLRRIIEEHWIRWAGPPDNVIMDPAPTMLGEALQAMFERDGSMTNLIAAEAHWQLGRTENHGGWFARVLDKVLQEQGPTDKPTWEICVRQAHVKNQMIQSYGYTPHQYVFGRNPSMPGDLLNEPLHVVPATAGLSDCEIEKAQAIRTAARKAVVELQDDKALRQALLARPRVPVDFHAGELVAYWRAQKYSKAQGTVIQGGQWHGTAMVIGKVGRNFIIAHRKQVLRCAPEQLRLATNEEKALIETPEAELLGIKDLIEGGTFKGQQYVDLVPGQYPPTASGSYPPAETKPAEEPEQSQESNAPPEEPPVLDSPMPSVPAASPEPDSSAIAVDAPVEPDSSSTYGPIRRRVYGKSADQAMYRPPAMRDEDFVEIMHEIAPQLIDQAMEETRSASSSERLQAPKRHLDNADAEEPAVSRARVSSGAEEVLCVSEVSACQDDIDVLIAAHVQKKATKEIHHSGHDSHMQSLINASKAAEWSTILEKHAVKVHLGKRAQAIREKFPHRFIGSRFVITRKPLDEGSHFDEHDPNTFRVKSRWCLQGHLDPDLETKAQDGMLQSPTLSQPSRVLLMQVIASFGWDLELGDIKGAFMEAGPLDSKYRPLYARMPAGGGEAQAMATASGSVEWLTLLLLETLEGHFALKDARAKLQHRPPIFATDCKSLFDHLISPSAPTSIEDRRTSIDVVIIRESLSCTAGVVRWLPTNRMIADGLTKDKADPIDLLRSCVRQGPYQISPEELVLRQQAEERERRKQKSPSAQNASFSHSDQRESVSVKVGSDGSEQLEGCTDENMLDNLKKLEPSSASIDHLGLVPI